MAAVKLTYFNLRARGEPIRLLLAYGGVKYEDERVIPSWEDPAPWAALKPTTPYGQLPVLSWDGVVIAQSMACARFVAKEIGVAGRTNLEKAQVDEIIDCIQDLINKGATLFFAKDDEGLKNHMTVTLPTALGQLEKRLEARGGQFMVGNSFTFADLHLFGYISELPDKSILDGFPKIKNLTDRVGNLPNIKAWVQSRPVTEM
eukprot:TRINITY_DN6140_c0_g1_i1.p1 TRINITY_DN6140_c0_g1~~TRINITY_DN6140_c0_g1_i1.p1  ORF type:complete len:203 (-),score=57.98 TRINITY_DN6140_c0_g1_i1:65-673(-)